MFKWINLLNMTILPNGYYFTDEESGAHIEPKVTELVPGRVGYKQGYKTIHGAA